MSKEEIGKHLFLALVQTKNNHALLEHRIHRKFLDLSVLCNYEFSVGKELLSIGLSKMLLDQIQLSEEDAFNLAYKNSCARGILRQDATFYSLVKLEMRLNPELEMPDVHLAYSLDGEYGANIMLNKQFLKMASDRFGGDYYVIPASIYELILISGKIDRSEEERTALNKMIGEANKVAKMEKFILSDHAYFYNSKTHKLECVYEEE